MREALTHSSNYYYINHSSFFISDLLTVNTLIVSPFPSTNSTSYSSESLYTINTVPLDPIGIFSTDLIVITISYSLIISLYFFAGIAVTNLTTSSDLSLIQAKVTSIVLPLVPVIGIT